MGCPWRRSRKKVRFRPGQWRNQSNSLLKYKDLCVALRTISVVNRSPSLRWSVFVSGRRRSSEKFDKLLREIFYFRSFCLLTGGKRRGRDPLGRLPSESPSCLASTVGTDFKCSTSPFWPIITKDFVYVLDYRLKRTDTQRTPMTVFPSCLRFVNAFIRGQQEGSESETDVERTTCETGLYLRRTNVPPPELSPGLHVSPKTFPRRSRQGLTRNYE